MTTCNYPRTTVDDGTHITYPIWATLPSTRLYLTNPPSGLLNHAHYDRASAFSLMFSEELLDIAEIMFVC